MKSARTRKFATKYQEEKTPEIENISYDIFTLRITLNFPGIEGRTYVEFEHVVGFRLLDEGDLLEFWNQESRSLDWIWIVEEGGWLGLEQVRSGFTSGHNFDGNEYLITGINECLSVLSTGQPKISHYSADA